MRELLVRTILQTRFHLLCIVLIAWGTLTTNALATTATIEFSGFRWRIKMSNEPVSPGNNIFSNNAANVFVDTKGMLHLRITKREDIWTCVELACDTTLGYGDYVLYTNSRVDNMDRNIVLSMDIGTETNKQPDDDVEPQPELAIRFTKWAAKSSINSLVYTVKPTRKKEPIVHYPQFPFVMSGDFSTHVAKWREHDITFISYHDHGNPSPWVGDRWRFPPQAADSLLVPTPSKSSTVRIGLWLIGTTKETSKNAPAKNNTVEVVLSRFEFMRLLSPPRGGYIKR